MEAAELRGYVDVALQSHVQGWAASGVEPTEVIVLINGEYLATVRPTVPRPDLVAHGLPENSGFTFNFPRPLTIDDTVSILFPDGTHLEGSPCIGHKERLRRLLHGIDLIRETGLELGPLDRPILAK